jgi:hypothetical protein
MDPSILKATLSQSLCYRYYWRWSLFQPGYYTDGSAAALAPLAGYECCLVVAGLTIGSIDAIFVLRGWKSSGETSI